MGVNTGKKSIDSLYSRSFLDTEKCLTMRRESAGQEPLPDGHKRVTTMSRGPGNAVLRRQRGNRQLSSPASLHSRHSQRSSGRHLCRISPPFLDCVFLPNPRPSHQHFYTFIYFLIQYPFTLTLNHSSFLSPGESVPTPLVFHLTV